MQSNLLLENHPASKSMGAATSSPPVNNGQTLKVNPPHTTSAPEEVVPPASNKVALALPGPKKPSQGEGEDFDWGDTDSVVIPAQPAIAVYFNPRGEIVIRQESQFHPDEDHFVYVGRQNLRPLIERLQQIDRE